jgi:hypothetical protein
MEIEIVGALISELVHKGQTYHKQDLNLSGEDNKYSS